MRRHHADVILAHYNLPIGRSCPAATIVHDVAFLRVPETFALAQRKRLQFSIRRSVSCSEAIVTSSEFSRDELLDCYPSLEKADVVVAPAAPSPSYFQRLSPEKLNEIRSRYLLPAEFVLCVGNVQPRKNLIRTAEAVARSQIPLVLVGQRHGRRLSMPDSARWLGYVPGGDLAALFQLCSVFCYVSRYEGFGLPVIEALASGAVVVTSSTSSLPEVAGEAALLADPHSVEAISAAIQRGLTDTQLRRELQAAGPLRAGQFTYDGSATRVLDRLRQIAT
jgi:alpha-1,3-rhamnosyl/mannosyltransferase